MESMSPEVMEQRVAQVLAHATTDEEADWGVRMARASNHPIAGIIAGMPGKRVVLQSASHNERSTNMHSAASIPTSSTAEIYARRRDAVASARTRRTGVHASSASNGSPPAIAQDIYASRASAAAAARERSRG